MAGAGIGLGDLIVRTAEEIRDARNRSAATGDPVLKFEGCELELKVTMSAEGGAGIKVWLLDLSAKGRAEHASTITLRFGPTSDGKVVFFTQADATRPLGPGEPSGAGTTTPIEPAHRAKVQKNIGTNQ